MGMTLGVKNTFGFINAFEKAKWHFRAGQDRLLFASMLIDIHNIVKPSLTVLDGIIGMDGDGPSSGRPRNLGILGISKNAFILDEYVEKLDPPSPPYAHNPPCRKKWINTPIMKSFMAISPK